MKLIKNNYFLSSLEDANKSTYGKRKGDAGATYAKYRAKMDGYIVSSEESDAFEFDFIVFNNGCHFSVQAKATTQGRRLNSSEFVPVKRVRRHEDGRAVDTWMRYKYVDIFAFIDLRFDPALIAWIPFDLIKNTKYIIYWKEFEHWSLSRIIGDPDISLHGEECLDVDSFVDDNIGLQEQQELFEYKGENNGN